MLGQEIKGKGKELMTGRVQLAVLGPHKEGRPCLKRLEKGKSKLSR